MSRESLFRNTGFCLLLVTLVVVLSLLAASGRKCQGSDMKLSFGPHVRIGAWPPAGYVDLWAETSVWLLNEQLRFLMGAKVLELKNQEFPDYFTGLLGVVVEQHFEHDTAAAVGVSTVSWPGRWPYGYYTWHHVTGVLSKSWYVGKPAYPTGQELRERFIQITAAFASGIYWFKDSNDYNWLIEFSFRLDLCQTWDWSFAAEGL